MIRPPLRAVEELEGRVVLSAFTVTTAADAGPGSLRAVIALVNADPGSATDRINFNVPGKGPVVIRPASALPAITHMVLIDGYSQPGARVNTLAAGDNAVIRVELVGSKMGGKVDGLTIDAGKSTVRGLAIDGFAAGIHLRTKGGDLLFGNFLGAGVTGTSASSGNTTAILVDATDGNVIGSPSAYARNLISGNTQGVMLQNASHNLLLNNEIGTDRTGEAGLQNVIFGVEVVSGVGNTIGGATPGMGNVISGNYLYGIILDSPDGSPGPSGTVIQGNLIGVDAAGTVTLPNYDGITMAVATDTLIGGTTAGARNIVSGNLDDGIYARLATGTTIQGNFIGTDRTGLNPLGNGSDGIQFVAGPTGAANNLVGGTAPGAANVIAFNAFNGVGIDAATTGNAVLSNAIYGNGNLGIDLLDNGVTTNHPGGPRSGPNAFQNFPVLTKAVTAGGKTTIMGTLNSAPNSTFTVQLFANPTITPPGYGQGQTYLGSATVTTDGSGNASFTFSTTIAVPVGQSISATATDAIGDTSEFGKDIAVTAS